MVILFGIIFFHILVILRCKMSEKEGKEGLPYLSVFLISVSLVGYVVIMLFLMDPPQK